MNMNSLAGLLLFIAPLGFANYCPPLLHTVVNGSFPASYQEIPTNTDCSFVILGNETYYMRVQLLVHIATDADAIKVSTTISKIDFYATTNVTFYVIPKDTTIINVITGGTEGSMFQMIYDFITVPNFGDNLKDISIHPLHQAQMINLEKARSSSITYDVQSQDENHLPLEVALFAAYNPKDDKLALTGVFIVDSKGQYKNLYTLHFEAAALTDIPTVYSNLFFILVVTEVPLNSYIQLCSYSDVNWLDLRVEWTPSSTKSYSLDATQHQPKRPYGITFFSDDISTLDLTYLEFEATENDNIDIITGSVLPRYANRLHFYTTDDKRKLLPQRIFSGMNSFILPNSKATINVTGVPQVTNEWTVPAENNRTSFMTTTNYPLNSTKPTTLFIENNGNLFLARINWDSNAIMSFNAIDENNDTFYVHSFQPAGYNCLELVATKVEAYMQPPNDYTPTDLDFQTYDTSETAARFEICGGSTTAQTTQTTQSMITSTTSGVTTSPDVGTSTSVNVPTSQFTPVASTSGETLPSTIWGTGTSTSSKVSTTQTTTSAFSSGATASSTVADVNTSTNTKVSTIQTTTIASTSRATSLSTTLDARTATRTNAPTTQTTTVTTTSGATLPSTSLDAGTATSTNVRTTQTTTVASTSGTTLPSTTLDAGTATSTIAPTLQTTTVAFTSGATLLSTTLGAGTATSTSALTTQTTMITFTTETSVSSTISDTNTSSSKKVPSTQSTTISSTAETTSTLTTSDVGTPTGTKSLTTETTTAASGSGATSRSTLSSSSTLYTEPTSTKNPTSTVLSSTPFSTRTLSTIFSTTSFSSAPTTGTTPRSASTIASTAITIPVTSTTIHTSTVPNTTKKFSTTTFSITSTTPLPSFMTTSQSIPTVPLTTITAQASTSSSTTTSTFSVHSSVTTSTTPRTSSTGRTTKSGNTTTNRITETTPKTSVQTTKLPKTTKVTTENVSTTESYTTTTVGTTHSAHPTLRGCSGITNLQTVNGQGKFPYNDDDVYIKNCNCTFVIAVPTSTYISLEVKADLNTNTNATVINKAENLRMMSGTYTLYSPLDIKITLVSGDEGGNFSLVWQTKPIPSYSLVSYAVAMGQQPIEIYAFNAFEKQITITSEHNIGLVTLPSAGLSDQLLSPLSGVFLYDGPTTLGPYLGSGLGAFTTVQSSLNSMTLVTVAQTDSVSTLLASSTKNITSDHAHGTSLLNTATFNINTNSKTNYFYIKSYNASSYLTSLSQSNDAVVTLYAGMKSMYDSSIPLTSYRLNDNSLPQEIRSGLYTFVLNQGNASLVVTSQEPEGSGTGTKAML